MLLKNINFMFIICISLVTLHTSSARAVDITQLYSTNVYDCIKNSSVNLIIIKSYNSAG
jgi:hypothetical protein